MRLIFVLFVLLTIQTQAQPKAGTCFYSKRQQILGSSCFILLPLEKNQYLAEHYTYGMGIFWGAPARDTFYLENDSLKSKQYTITIKSNKLILVGLKNKTRFRYHIIPDCNPEVNQTRNWTYREVVFYDKKLSDSFRQATDSLLHTTCHEAFKKRIEAMLVNGWD